MTAIAAFLSTQPLLALFITIALGYGLGAVSIKGFSLGSGAVLFVGLAVGAVAPKSALPNTVGALGLLLFLYGVGIAYGAHFSKVYPAPKVSAPISLQWSAYCWRWPPCYWRCN